MGAADVAIGVGDFEEAMLAIAPTLCGFVSLACRISASSVSDLRMACPEGLLAHFGKDAKLEPVVSHINQEILAARVGTRGHASTTS